MKIYYCLFLILLSLLSCKKTINKNNKSTYITDSIYISLPRTLEAFPLFFAEKKHLFPNNLKITILITNPSECLSNFKNHLYNPHISLLDSIQRKTIQNKYINLKNNLTYWGIISNQKLRLKNIEDLNHRIIATDPYSSSNYNCTFILSKNKINNFSIGRPQIENYLIGTQMIESNQIDAIILPEPYLSYCSFHGCIILGKNIDDKLSTNIIINKNISKSNLSKYKLLLKRTYNEAIDSILDSDIDRLKNEWNTFFKIPITSLTNEQKHFLQQNKWK